MRGVTMKESEILNNALKGDIDKKPMTTLRILAKYYFLEGNDKVGVELNLDEYMNKFYIGYKPSKWKELLNQLVKSVSQYNSFEIKDIDYIEVTNSEWDRITNLNNKQLEKLAFILLVYSKINNIRVFENDNRVNQNLTDIFGEAHVKMIDDNKKLLNHLFKLEYISQGRSCSATAIRVEFLNKYDEVKFKIDNFVNVLSYYDEYKNEKKYVECKSCKKRIIQKKHNIKYCSKCAKKVKNEQNKGYFSILRKAEKK